MSESGQGRLAGKVALISGGARGMGASHARMMVAEGARVVIGDVADVEGETLACDLGESAVYTHLDVRSRQDWAVAVSVATRSFGQLSVLVNNAGIVNSAPFDRYSDEQWDSILAVNLTGVFNGMRAAVEALKQSAPSSIVNISSTAGIRGFANLPGYTATKFAVRGLTKAAALDLGHHGVRVNSVHPGVVDTPMTMDMVTPQTHVALARTGRPEEISTVVVFLASDEASYVTGAEFVADGGDTAGLAKPSADPPVEGS